MPIQIVVNIGYAASQYRDLTPPRRDIVELDIQSRCFGCDGVPGVGVSTGRWSEPMTWGELAWRLGALVFGVWIVGDAGVSCGCR